MSDVQLERIEARLRTLTILQQRTRLQIERMGADLAELLTATKSVRDRRARGAEDGTV